MPPKGAGTVDQLPASVRDEINSYRAKGYGPSRTHKAMCETLAPYGVTRGEMHAYFYRDRGEAQAVSRDRIGRIADLLDRSGIDPADIDQVKAIKLSEWQGLTKDEEGEAHIHDLEGASIVLTPAWETGPKWQPVDRGPAIKLPRPLMPQTRSDGMRVAALIPDVQIGFWRDIDTGKLTPFHDETAMATALQIVRLVDPDDLIILGDFIDLAPLSRFEQEPGFALTVQPSIDRATLFAAELVCAAPRSTKRVYLEGNHDRRLQKSIVNNAASAFGLRPGWTPPDTWPDLSIPHLLRLDEFAIDYISGYPAAHHWVNENTVAIHGHRVTSAGSTAARVVDDARINVIFAHTHRVEMMHRTRMVYEGERSSFAVSLGCLCRIDGAVPSTKGSTDVFGRPVPTVENWQHSVGIVTYEPGNGLAHVEPVPIYGGRAIYRGELIAA